ncbi:MAG: hypothetical protein LBK82_08580 [Planctomycetaceae bacterium]|jgi:hypothetical protein|nr:hypothetical protein [Planctomycetaceae bacterium]
MKQKLTQAEADALIQMEKFYTGTDIFDFPSMGGSLRIPLHSADKREDFTLDISRNKIAFERNKLQTRVRKTIILVRIDIGGQPHRNPDGEEINCPHLHLYREGFDDKWAISLPSVFIAPSNIFRTLNEFMDYCNIITKHFIRRDLFI